MGSLAWDHCSGDRGQGRVVTVALPHLAGPEKVRKSQCTFEAFFWKAVVPCSLKPTHPLFVTDDFVEDK